LLLGAAYLVVALPFAWQLLLPHASFFRWDTLIYTWPLYETAREQLAAGRVPAWAPGFACGTPLLANVNAGLLYPLRVLHWLLPVSAGFKLFVYAHLWLTLLATHCFLRRGLRLGPTAAVVGALCFAAGGYARGMWDTYNLVSFPWIPLGLWALLTAAKPHRKRCAVAGITLAMLMLLLGGDTQAAVVWVLAAGWLAVLHPRRHTMVPALLAGVVLAALMAAPQWLPTLSAFGNSYRAEGLPFHQATERSFHPLRLLELFVPHLFGTHALWYAGALSGSGARNLSPWTGSLHVGIVPLLGLLTAWRYRQRHYLVWAATLAVTGLLLSFGRNLPGYDLWLTLPIAVGFRFPEKYLLWTSFALAVMLATGVRPFLALWRLQFPTPRRRMAALWLALLAVCMALAVSLAPSVFMPNRHNVNPSDFRHWVMMRSLGSVVLAVPFALLLSRRTTRAAPVFLLGTALSLLTAWYLEQPLTTEYDPTASPPIAQALLGSHDPTGRYLADPAARLVPMPEFWPELAREDAKEAVYHASALEYNAARTWNCRAADGFSPLESAGMRALRLGHARPYDGSTPDVEDLASFCRLTAVRWLLTTPERAVRLGELGLDVYAYRRWQNRMQQSVLLYIDGQAEAWWAHEYTDTGFPPEEKVDSQVSLHRDGPDRLRIELASQRDSRLVVSETYDPGWVATDQDGGVLATSPWKGVLLSVITPADARSVHLSYRVPGGPTGCVLCAGGFLLAIVFAARRRTQRPCPRAP
jgi:hypothetical protein